jgi:hypothetical protein
MLSPWDETEKELFYLILGVAVNFILSALQHRMTGLLVGNDVRKAAADGFPADQIVASDLRPGNIILYLQSRNASRLLHSP